MMMIGSLTMRMTMDGIIEVEEKKETNKLYRGMFINLTIHQ